MNTRLRIRIPGVVQGAGFRPWVYRLAVERGISGFVRNIGWGVAIEVQAESAEMIESFLGAVSIRSPRHSWRLESLSPIHGEQIFRIAGSEITDAVDPVLSPDVGICEKCRTELWEPGNRRYQYPFISCAECGPRQSITFRLPFDRAQTSWSEFSMCPSCELEYADCRDRRFHAQTISCPNCGPRFAFLNRDGQILAGGNEAIEVAAQHILHGEIIAIKGVGGFHLFVDASNESAVKELRRRKLREDKPFALMVASSKEAMRLARWSPIEMSALYSREAPIVLVRRRVDEDRIAQSVAPGLNQLGIMLASTGLHSLLLFKVGKPVVATSGNVSDEPICIDEDEATIQLRRVADGFLVHRLKIQNRFDDSIVQAIEDSIVCVRRSRGYPLQIDLNLASNKTLLGETLLGAGADMKSAVAVFCGDKKVFSPHLGALQTLESIDVYEKVLSDLPKVFGLAPARAIVDLHPDYRSTRLAGELGVPILPVQHHCAHVAAAIAENDLLSDPVLGVSWDGTGYGLDGTSWGGEFFLFSPACIERVGSLRLFSLLGGEAAVREPRRVALALALEAEVKDVNNLLGAQIRDDEFTIWSRCLKDAPKTSSVGRMFDGVAALLGICSHTSYEGQAAMELQARAEVLERAFDESQTLFYRAWDGDVQRWDWRPLIRELAEGMIQQESPSNLARRFHLWLARLILEQARVVFGSHGIRKVVLSGGVFQNAFLMDFTIRILREDGFEPYWNRLIPAHDGGIAIGQLTCASVYQDALKKFQAKSPKSF